MSVAATSARGPVKYVQKGGADPSVEALLGYLGAIVVYGALFTILFRDFAPGLFPALTVLMSRPQTRRETVLALLGSVITAGLVAIALILVHWREGPRPTDGWFRAVEPWFLLAFLPALLAMQVTAHSLGRATATPAPGDALTWYDHTLWHVVLLITGAHLVATALGYVIQPAPAELGCGLPVALQLMLLFALLGCGSTAVLAWNRAAGLRAALLARAGLALGFVWLAHEAGRRLDCALAGGWQGPAAAVVAIAIYIGAVVLAILWLHRYARRLGLLRPAEWDAIPEGDAG